jgi:D-3-phosphoglycerate dehydrogenase
MERPARFIVTDYVEPDLEWEKGECKKLGIDFTALQMKDASPKELIDACGMADILLVNMAKMVPEVMKGLSNVKVVIRHGIGYDNLDLPSATEAGIICANQPKASNEDVAEHAITLMFAAFRKIKKQESIMAPSIASGRWEYAGLGNLYRIAGRTVGIVGCGNIGSHIVKKLAGFKMRCLVYDPYLSADRAKELGVVLTDMDTLLKESDMVTVHVPVTDETRGMFNKDLFKKMKPTAVFVNTSRGALVNAEDLAAALRSGTIAGAGVDVYVKEPPEKDHPLLGLENAILTPHYAWSSFEGAREIREMIIDDVKRFLKGEPPLGVVNPKVLSSPQLRFKSARR